MNTTQPAKSTPYAVFLHLMMMSMTLVSIVAVITLIMQYIDLAFPDELIWYGSIYEAIRNSSSALIVAFPVFLISSSLIAKDLAESPGKKDMLIRRWLIYLALFVISITIIVDLIQLIDHFYSGELTLPFFLKVLTVLVISALAFVYFKWDLTRDRKPSKLPRFLAALSSSALILILGVGFFFTGSPNHQRHVRLDEERVQDLQQIAYEITEYWRQKETLPQQLSDLERDVHYFELPFDPHTDEPYEYEVVDEWTFILCAHFDLESQILPNEKARMSQWYHSAGRVCFEKTIDPDFYPSELPVIFNDR